jgi:hypothetical protein
MSDTSFALAQSRGVRSGMQSRRALVNTVATCAREYRRDVCSRILSRRVLGHAAVAHAHKCSRCPRSQRQPLPTLIKIAVARASDRAILTNYLVYHPNAIFRLHEPNLRNFL